VFPSHDQQANPVVQNVEPETIEQINWKKFREVREVERKERDAAQRKAAEKEAEATALKAAMESLLNKTPNNAPHNSYSDDIDETEEQRINKLVDAAMSKREQALQAERLKKEQQEALPLAMKTFSDFSQIYTDENVDYLKFHHPELADSLQREPDSFDKWSKVYKALKRYIPNPNSHKEQAKAEKNFNKPQAMAVSGMTSTGDTAPIDSSDSKRAANWKRMQQVMKRAS